MNKSLFFTLCMVLSFSMLYAQEKNNSIGIIGALGLSDLSLQGNAPNFDYSYKNGPFVSSGIEYSRHFSQLELAVEILFDLHSHSLIQKVDSLLIGSTSLFVGMEHKEKASLYYIQYGPKLTYHFKLSEDMSLSTGISFDINHIFKDELHIITTFKDVLDDEDSVYTNASLPYFRKSVFSGRINLGISYQLSDNISLDPNIFYESFLHTLVKPAYADEFWARPYNYGFKMGIKYHF